MIQNFLSKANEISTLEGSMSSKKKNKNEKNDKNLLLEKIELFKKKIESDNFFAAVIKYLIYINIIRNFLNIYKYIYI